MLGLNSPLLDLYVAIYATPHELNHPHRAVGRWQEKRYNTIGELVVVVRENELTRRTLVPAMGQHAKDAGVRCEVVEIEGVGYIVQADKAEQRIG